MFNLIVVLIVFFFLVLLSKVFEICVLESWVVIEFVCFMVIFFLVVKLGVFVIVIVDFVLLVFGDSMIREVLLLCLKLIDDMGVVIFDKGIIECVCFCVVGFIIFEVFIFVEIVEVIWFKVFLLL